MRARGIVPVLLLNENNFSPEMASFCVVCVQTDIFSGALFIRISLGWDLYVSTVGLIAVTAVFTIAGR